MRVCITEIEALFRLTHWGAIYCLQLLDIFVDLDAASNVCDVVDSSKATVLLLSSVHP